jgi:CheY-like chemotaxis protein
MNISQSISPHLPYLRRFARALNGAQEAGDAYALATLEAIVAEPAMFKTDIDPKIALYSVFLAVWNSVASKTERPLDVPLGGIRSDDPTMAGALRLGALTPRSRVAFVLSAIEGFSAREIGQTMGCTTAEAEALLRDVGGEMATQLTTDVLIIEDEPIIAMDIETLVEELGHRVLKVARTHKEAVEAVKRNKPGLILADVQLADGSSGIDAANEILNIVNVPVIFITAYPERLLTGERPEPAFLISKPFRHEMVKGVISQALYFDQKSWSAHKRAAG